VGGVSGVSRGSGGPFDPGSFGSITQFYRRAVNQTLCHTPAGPCARQRLQVAEKRWDIATPVEEADPLWSESLHARMRSNT